MRNTVNDGKEYKNTHTHTKHLKTSKATKHIIINSVIKTPVKSVAPFVLFMPALLLLL